MSDQGRSGIHGPRVTPCWPGEPPPGECPFLSLVVSYMTNMSMMRIRPSARLVPGLAVLAVLLGPRPAVAQPDGDRHVWVQAVAVLAVSENWRVHLEEQPRWFDDGTALFQNLLRTAVGRRVGGRASVWAGHAWVAKPQGTGVRHEQRAWQQVLVTPPPARVILKARG